MKVLSVALCMFLMATISWLDHRLTGHVHFALMLPVALISFAFSFVREKKTSLLVLSALILILSFSKRTADTRQASVQRVNATAASVTGQR